jgi:hypothetical protein
MTSSGMYSRRNLEVSYDVSPDETPNTYSAARRGEPSLIWTI